MVAHRDRGARGRGASLRGLWSTPPGATAEQAVAHAVKVVEQIGLASTRRGTITNRWPRSIGTAYLHGDGPFS